MMLAEAQQALPEEQLALPWEQEAMAVLAESLDAKEAPKAPRREDQTEDSKERQTYITKYSTIKAAEGPALATD